MGVALNTLHHGVERAEVVRVESELWVSIAADFHRTSVIANNSKVVGDGPRHVGHLAIQQTCLLLNLYRIGLGCLEVGVGEVGGHIVFSLII